MTNARKTALKGYAKGHLGWGPTFSSPNMTRTLLDEGLIEIIPEKKNCFDYFLITEKGKDLLENS